MKKRNVFDELVQGFDDLAAEREGKITLKSTVLEATSPIELAAAQITAIRENLNYSQGVFAALLRTNVSTLRNWEQGRAKPNAQAALLLKLVESAPEEILGRLSTLEEPSHQPASGNPQGRPKRLARAQKTARKSAVA